MATTTVGSTSTTRVDTTRTNQTNRNSNVNTAIWWAVAAAIVIAGIVFAAMRNRTAVVDSTTTTTTTAPVSDAVSPTSPATTVPPTTDVNGAAAGTMGTGAAMENSGAIEQNTAPATTDLNQNPATPATDADTGATTAPQQ